MEIIEDSDELQCTDIHWSALSPQTSLKDCFDITIGQWYGGGTVTQPISNQNGNSSFTTNGYSAHILDAYWFSTSNVSIYSQYLLAVEIIDKAQICLSGVESVASSESIKWLNYTICGVHIGLKVHQPSLANHVKNVTLRNYNFDQMMYSTHLLPILSQDVLLDYVSSLLTPCVLVIDLRWQLYEGDFEFDDKKFKNVTHMMKQFNDNNIDVILEVSSYVNIKSDWFGSYTDGFFVSEALSDIPLLVSLEGDAVNGPSLVGIIKMSNESLIHLDAVLSALKEQYDVYGFSFKGSWADIIPPGAYKSQSLTNLYTKQYGEFAASVCGNDPLFLQSVLNLHHLDATIIVDINHNCSSDTFLLEFINHLLALTIIGYTKVVPNLVCGHKDNEFTGQMFHRYLQLVSFLPIFNIPLSTHLNASDVKSMAARRKILSLYSTYNATLKDTLQLTQPVWYGDEIVDHELMVNNHVIIVPFFTQTRNVYLPAGRWHDLVYSGGDILGPTWIYNVSHVNEQPLLFMKLSD